MAKKKGLKAQAGQDFPGDAYSKPHPKRNPMKWRWEKRYPAKSTGWTLHDTETGAHIQRNDGGKEKNTRVF